MRQAIKNHREVPPRKMSSLGVKVPRRLATFVERCLEKDPERRFADAQEAYAFLDPVVNPRMSPVKVLAPVVGVA